jgi:hypothetical protein
VRFRESRLLRACAAVSFVQYGALIAVLLSGALQFWFVGTLALLSLGSWFFLFAWYPFLETMIGPDAAAGRGRTVGQVLEAVGILCVAAVHAILLLLLGSRI